MADFTKFDAAFTSVQSSYVNFKTAAGQASAADQVALDSRTAALTTFATQIQTDTAALTPTS